MKFLRSPGELVHYNIQDARLENKGEKVIQNNVNENKSSSWNNDKRENSRTAASDRKSVV